MNRYLIGALLAVAVVSGAWLHGFQTGGGANEAKHAEARAALQRSLFDAADRQSELAAEIERLDRDLRSRAIVAEDGARADPAASARRPGADSLRRLEAR